MNSLEKDVKDDFENRLTKQKLLNDQESKLSRLHADHVKRVNRFNGESVMLTPKEAKIHDEIFIHEVEATLEDYKLGRGASKHWQKMI